MMIYPKPSSSKHCFCYPPLLSRSRPGEMKCNASFLVECRRMSLERDVYQCVCLAGWRARPSPRSALKAHDCSSSLLPPEKPTRSIANSPHTGWCCDCDWSGRLTTHELFTSSVLGSHATVINCPELQQEFRPLFDPVSPMLTPVHRCKPRAGVSVPLSPCEAFVTPSTPVQTRGTAKYKGSLQ